MWRRCSLKPIHESHGEALIRHETGTQSPTHLGYQGHTSFCAAIGSAWMLGTCSVGTMTI